MKTITATALLALAAAAGLAQAQQNPRLLPNPAPPHQHPEDWQCVILGENEGMTDAPTLWPGGIIYYEFDSTVAPYQMAAAIQGMSIWMDRVGAPNVRFLKHTPGAANEPFRIRMESLEGSISSSYIGVIATQPQRVQIGTTVGAYTMAHEFGHALGFYHEQSRPDRDTFITILWNNIQSGYSSQFNLQSAGQWPSAGLNTPYDFDSIMHYRATAFSICSSPSCNVVSCCTMLTNPGYHAWQCEMGQRDHLSVLDVQDMVNVYGLRTTPIYYVDTFAFGGGTLGTIANPFPLVYMVPPSTQLQDVYLAAGTHTVPAGMRLTSKGRYQRHGGIARIR